MYETLNIVPGLIKGNVFFVTEPITDYTSFNLSWNDEELTMVKIQNNAGDAELSCICPTDGEKLCLDLV